MSLARSFVLGSVYLGAGSWLAYLLNFGMQIAIARLLATPLLLLAACAGAFAALDAAGMLAWAPWYLRPFLPPVVYVLALLAAEQRRLISELHYLIDQLRRGA